MNQSHWENVYQNKPVNQVSWFQQNPKVSLELIEHARLPKEANIIDVGSGATRLISELVALGFYNVTVLDISRAALAKAKAQLKSLHRDVNTFEWLVGDITQIDLDIEKYALWHDRAVFHFLTEREQRQAYIRNLHSSLKKNGEFIVATFSLDGPEKCSGLPVVRYDVEGLVKTFGPSFELLETKTESHQTPFDTEQAFVYCRFKKIRS
ncbi:class I SAM-dependent methyltransferase [Aliikangiella marina]|nr:class I SAM-dependent methyltransferase [Aliikangiella marina]